VETSRCFAARTWSIAHPAPDDFSCARAASVHAAVPPPSRPVNSRLFIQSPRQPAVTLEGHQTWTRRLPSWKRPGQRGICSQCVSPRSGPGRLFRR